MCLMGYFLDDQHALRTGFLLGTLMKAGIEVSPDVDGDGNYTDELTVRLPDDDGLPPVTIRIKVLP